MNGRFGTELVYAGYNAGLLLTGRSDEPVYILVKDGRVEIRDAGHLWGKLNVETQQTLREEIRNNLDDQHFAIVVGELEARILSYGRLDRAAHATLRCEQGDADGLLVGAHGRVMAEGSSGRNAQPRLKAQHGLQSG